MKILFLCGREYSYTRNSVIYNALVKNFEVINISSNKNTYFQRYFEIIKNFLITRHDYDCIYIGFYGQPLVLFVKLFTKKPIIFDAFISTFQTLCYDRKKFSPNSIIGKIAFYLDKLSCRFANRIILDTNAHIDYFVSTFKLDKSKFSRIFVGADESLFFPREDVTTSQKKVFFYSEYQPLHGVEYIVKAAKLLENTDIIFTIVGKGQERQRIDELAHDLNIQNITFINWVPYNELPQMIAESSLCIGGHLGASEKAGLVIAGKTFQFIAMKKLTLISKNKANSELFPDTTKPYFIEQANEKDLAEKIKKNISDRLLVQDLVSNQYNLYKKVASNSVISNEIQQIINSILIN